MKKVFVIITAILAVSALASCGKKPEEGTAGGADKQAEIKETLAPEATGQLSSSIEKAAVPAEDTVKNTESVEKDFSGMWIASKSTTSNPNLNTLEIKITYDGYKVNMTFSSDDVPSAEYSGKYKIKDGILTFDKNFDGCTAYFSADDADTLVLDNGSSLIYCEREAEGERE